MPLSDAQSRAFGKAPAPFGQHKGDPVDQIPLEELEKLATDYYSGWRARLRQYLASARVRAEETT